MDGLLLDTGCSYTARELRSYFEKDPLMRAANADYQMDCIGTHQIIQERFGINIYVHP